MKSSSNLQIVNLNSFLHPLLVIAQRNSYPRYPFKPYFSKHYSIIDQKSVVL